MEKLVGIDHVGIATDDMFSTALVVDFAKANADMYADGGYMIDAFNRGATGNGELVELGPLQGQAIEVGRRLEVVAVTTEPVAAPAAPEPVAAPATPRPVSSWQKTSFWSAKQPWGRAFLTFPMALHQWS